MGFIEKILIDIKVGCFFDSHYVTESMKRFFSDEYNEIIEGIGPTNERTLRAHQKIGHLIKSFKGKLVERQPAQSWSININGKSNSCALWKRI